MNYIVRDLEDDAGLKRCGAIIFSKVSEDNKCQNPATAPHMCPYQTEINNDHELCTCCESCSHECYMDI